MGQANGLWLSQPRELPPRHLLPPRRTGSLPGSPQISPLESLKRQKYFLTPDFCSDEAYFETYRGTRGSWVRVLDNIRAALKDPGLSHFQFKVTDISSYRIDDPAELDRRFEDLRSLFPASDRISFHRRKFHNAAGFTPVGDAKRKQSYHRCPYPWFSFMIASNGDVVACCRDLEHKTVLGNLLRQEFDEIWNGEQYQALRRALIDKKPEAHAACAGCDMPYDASKFSARNLAKTAVHRMLVFEKGSGQPKRQPREETIPIGVGATQPEFTR